MTDATTDGDRLDRLAQLRVVSSVMPAAAFVEVVLAAPYERVWSIVSDLEAGVPLFEPWVRRQRVVGSADGLMTVEAETVFSTRSTMRVELSEGWCLMSSPRMAIGMAAEPIGDRTRFAHFEAPRLRAAGIARPVLRWSIRRELRRLEQLALGRA